MIRDAMTDAVPGPHRARRLPQFAAHRPGAFARLAEVDRALRGFGGDVPAAYAAARLAVTEIEDTRGFAALRRIVAGVGQGRPCAEVLQDEARLSPEELEDRWRRGLP
jgi:hypothetical protein